MSSEPNNLGRAGALLREDPDAFDALRDLTADRIEVDPGAIEKDYWATEVLRSATTPLSGIDDLVFKGGTSLSKAYGIIKRFSPWVSAFLMPPPSGGMSSAVNENGMRRHRVVRGAFFGTSVPRWPGRPGNILAREHERGRPATVQDLACIHGWHDSEHE